jgi:hypothetical protein
MPQHSERFGFDVPDDFPLGRLEVVHARVSDGPTSIYTQDQPLWTEWAGGCNGTLYRFIGAAAASDEWVASSSRSVSPPIDERVRQEQSLFGFFTNALSSVECLAYGLCAIGEFLNPAFPVTTKPQAIKFSFAARTFTATFPSDRLRSVLTAADTSSEMRDLRTTRNILVHRAAPGRAYSETLATTGSGGSSVPGPTGWLGGDLGPATTEKPREWVAQTLDEILQAADEFTKNHL